MKYRVWSQGFVLGIMALLIGIIPLLSVLFIFVKGGSISGIIFGMVILFCILPAIKICLYNYGAKVYITNNGITCKYLLSRKSYSWTDISVVGQIKSNGSIFIYFVSTPLDEKTSKHILSLASPRKEGIVVEYHNDIMRYKKF